MFVLFLMIFVSLSFFYYFKMFVYGVYVSGGKGYVYGFKW